MDRRIMITAVLLGIISIVLGAFGAHALKKIISPEAIVTFEVGIRYQMYHALFLLFLATNGRIQEKTKKNILILTIFGVIFFSGSIYFLATNNLTSFDFKKIGFITPIGGLLLITAWSWLLIDLLKNKKQI
ncbi:DUF423 domain-containing protein [Flavobacterium sp.]|uniref:DUF423 domain-containing protein n=1 Tax=Flavobacterium sp. TaxID=239 RepID=UPI0026258D72|nr:DUF423 domain-containing protein [Flavobacterium sp.]MDD3004875.1 DUF423 domain-containing protein [Flavobacterium sp.]